MPSDRPVDRPARARDAAVNDRHVPLLDRPLAELTREPLERRPRARHEEDARRVAIEPVHDPGTLRRARCRQRTQAMRERVHDRPAPRAGGRMHDHPRGLVDREHIRVLVEDHEGQRLGLDRERLGLTRVDLDALARTHRVRRLADGAVHSHAARVDQLLGLRPRADAACRCDHPVEPPARGVRRHDEDDARHAHRPAAANVGSAARTCRARATSAAIAALSASGPEKAHSPRSRSTNSTTSQRR